MNSLQTLKQLYLEHKGKVTDKWSSYLDIWNDILISYREMPIRLLEIGIQNGGSLEIWGKYFPNAEKIVGCDINPECQKLIYDDDSIAIVIGDANSEESKNNIINISSEYDIIIDDGSHISSDIIKSFCNYFPSLSEGGVYLIEDLHCSYWDDFEGGLNNPYSAMAFFKRLTDVLNFEHWRNQKTRVNFLSDFIDKYNLVIDDFDINRIHSIKFHNSSLIIKKLEPSKNDLGKRIVVGDFEEINPGTKKLNQTSIQDLVFKVKEDSNLDIYELIRSNEKLQFEILNYEKIIISSQDQLTEYEQQKNSLQDQLTEYEQQENSLQDQLTEYEQQKNSLQDQLTEYEQQKNSLQDQLTEYEQQKNKFNQIIKSNDQEIFEFRKQNLENESNYAQLKDYLSEREQILQDLNSKLLEIYSSTAWNLIRKMWRLRLWLLPKGSWREKVVIFTIRPILVIYNKIRNLTNKNQLNFKKDDKAIFGTKFDPKWYRLSNPDLSDPNIDLFQHYIQFGRFEGRLGLPPAYLMRKGLIEFSSSKETIIIVCHEASLTGAPILGLNLVINFQKKYNIVTILLGEGVIKDNFLDHSSLVVGPMPKLPYNSDVVIKKFMIEKITNNYKIKFAIINSIESYSVLPELYNFTIPTVSLIHEFSVYTRPKWKFKYTVLLSDEVVFSSNLTKNNVFDENPELKNYKFWVLPQGRCIIPEDKNNFFLSEDEDRRILNIVRPENSPDDSIVIIGVGSVHIRKGIDLFIDCASKIVRSQNESNLKFIWIGNGYYPDTDLNYSIYLYDQIKRAGLEDHFYFIDETFRLETIYQSANIMLLTSRLDPFPNIAIDAMYYKLPFICFDQATGVAEILIKNHLNDYCVAPYLDTGKMAEIANSLINSKELRRTVGERLYKMLHLDLDMINYIVNLDKICLAACDKVTQQKKDAMVIENSGIARLDFFLSPNEEIQLEEACKQYVRPGTDGLYPRKMLPGFHPGIYKEFYPKEINNENPLAYFIQSGKPEGHWLFEVISPQTDIIEIPATTRIALHVHIYYPNLLDEIFFRLEKNKFHPDLLISVPKEVNFQSIQSKIKNIYTGKIIKIEDVPNCGRDIGPLLTRFGRYISENYDIIGHVHTKHSNHIGYREFATSWYIFLLENLLGGKTNMSDRILGKMIEDSSIGIVFPDDPTIVGWDLNWANANKISKKLGINKLPENIQFPVGSMFWSKVEALQPLFDLQLDWKDYPVEPIPIDGTLLHAIERIIPIVVSQQGFRSVLTNIPGVTRVKL